MPVLKCSDFVMVQGTTRFSGRIEELFRESWTPVKGGRRSLQKLPVDAEGPSRLLAAVRLVRPFDTGTEPTPPGFMPVLEEDDETAEVVYIPIDSLQTIPDYF